jgi:hypothetical protein
MVAAASSRTAATCQSSDEGEEADSVEDSSSAAAFPDSAKLEQELATAAEA